MAVLIDTSRLVDLERGVVNPQVEAAKGQVMGAHHLWIAATAVAHGMGVVTGNADEFRRVPGLRVIAAAD